MAPLLIFAPGSLRNVQEPIQAAFRLAAPEVEITFHPPAYSGLLAKQVLDGAPADLFISANWAYVDQLHTAGLMPEPRLLAGNRLALLVRKGLEAELRDLESLLRPGVRLLLPPAATDPLGQYAQELLQRDGLADAVRAKRERGEIAEHLGTLAEGLRTGQVDAAMMYASTASAFVAHATVLPLPPEHDMHEQIRFALGAVQRDGACHPDATRLVAFLTGAEGQSVLAAGGFIPLAQLDA